jgi:hypothetical protein
MGYEQLWTRKAYLNEDVVDVPEAGRGKKRVARRKDGRTAPYKQSAVSNQHSANRHRTTKLTADRSPRERLRRSNPPCEALRSLRLSPSIRVHPRLSAVDVSLRPQRLCGSIPQRQRSPFPVPWRQRQSRAQGHPPRGKPISKSHPPRPAQSPDPAPDP